MQFLSEIFEFFAWIFFWYTLTSFYIDYFLCSEAQFGLQTPQHSLKLRGWRKMQNFQSLCRKFHRSSQARNQPNGQFWPKKSNGGGLHSKKWQQISEICA